MHQSLKSFTAVITGTLIAGLLIAGCSKPKAGPPPTAVPEVGIIVIKPVRK